MRQSPERDWTISIVLPALNEGPALAGTLASSDDPRVIERIVVDGGSDDDTRVVAERLGATTLTAERGRARQMNAGARRARGDVLLFLHADTRLPGGFGAAVARAMQEGAASGRFDVEIEGRSRLLPLVARLMNARSRWTGIATGDQAIFVRREEFLAIGCFADLPLMEDVDLTRRLARAGPVAALRLRVRTSGRRWDSDGPVRTILRMWTFRLAFFLGVPASLLARRYRDTR